MKPYTTLNSLRLNTDGAASAGITDDPLSTNVSDIDLSRPLAPASNYELSITDAKLEDNKKKDGQNLVIKTKSTREIKSVKGDIMPAGSLVLTQYVSLTPSEKYTNKMIAQGIARLAKGLGLPGSITPRDVINNPTMLNGKFGIFKVKINQETAEFPEGNAIAGIVIEG